MQWLIAIAREFGPLIDAAGKLGPLTVALAVFWANRRQTEWTNAVSRRSSDVEDQKLRLSLLDRRIIAYEAVRNASVAFMAEGTVSEPTMAQLYKALHVAQLVYPADIESAVGRWVTRAHRWQFLESQQARYRDTDRPRYQLALDESAALEGELFDGLNQLVREIREATRVIIIPPLSGTPSWWTRIKRFAIRSPRLR